MTTPYIPLHVYSAYSLAEGAIPVKDLIKTCVERNIPAVAITDRHNLFGAKEFCTAAQKAGIQPIIGCTLRMLEHDASLVILVQNEIGYRNLCALLSKSFMSPEKEHITAVSLERLTRHSDGLFCLTGGAEGPIDKLLVNGNTLEAETYLSALKQSFGANLAVEIVRYGAPTLYENELIKLSDRLEIPLVASNPAWFLDAKQYEAHDALLCIAEGRYVSEQDRRKVSSHAWLKASQDIVDLFDDLPDAIENTSKIAKSCHYMLENVPAIFPAFDTKDGRSEEDELCAQAKDGLTERLKRVDADHQVYLDRLDFELNVINEMGFPGYFLIVSDFIRWAKDNKIPVGPGRGSGAGSVVAWALSITDLDPIRFDLLFERFLNPERVSLPDFDIDFCQERREEVIAYVQRKYGADRVAQIITFGKLQARAVIRDVGRVLQMSYGQVDRISKMIPNNPANPTTLQEALDGDPAFQEMRDNDETVDRLITVALQLEGLYRHASTHAAGVVIGPKPLQEIVPLYRDPKSDMPVTQFNMKVIEDAGLVKFDFLGLKTMTVIQRALDLLGNKFTTLDIPFDDTKTFEMLARGENTGVFQLESAGMRDLGKQMGLHNFEQISALVALFRPGPMENIPKYLACLHGTEEIDYMHDKLKPVTENTYGVMIYQEQVMQAAQVLAGYSLGEADLLRRAMGKKIKEEMDKEREKFVKGAASFSNVPTERANYIFDQIAKFAGYGFNKAHSACYALIAYWTAYLKANHPVEFMCASMILDQGNTDKLSIFYNECKRMGIDVLPPDVNASQVQFSIEGDAIRYGLCALKGAGTVAMGELVNERTENGVFVDLNGFLERLPSKAINKKQLEALICSGALDSLHDDRASLFAGKDVLLSHANMAAERRDSGQQDLFGGEGTALKTNIVDLLPKGDWDHLELLQYEFGVVGFYLSAHPLEGQMDVIESIGASTWLDLQEYMEDAEKAQVFTMAAVVMKRQERVSQRTGNKFAFLALSDTTGSYEVMIFSDTLEEYRPILEEGNMIIMTAEAEVKDGNLRMLGRMFQSMDDASKIEVGTYNISLNPMTQKSDLKIIENIIVNGGKMGKADIIMNVSNHKYKAQVRLPKKWHLPPATMKALKRANSVEKIKAV